ncbi:hypothetical protein Xvie_01901 [Xenorhabdus vietnamensis]|uniref:Uncharacterized protein n=1 Tax=Xenorhabdus vietnamensis TaxID=351656 RepID=A0A1Y2SCL3_9GAMM|nr:hypothetical protein [Xenorhabdus vietnamensis]OTA16447.1 hypothetical protein Xvie_01901 [Xenorhabdus vietnamensis]
MDTPLEKYEILYTIKKGVAAFLLIAIQKATDEGFDITDCHIDICFKEDLIDGRKYYIVSFEPREVTPENAMEYEKLHDDFTIKIDANTKEVVAAHPSK